MNLYKPSRTHFKTSDSTERRLRKMSKDLSKPGWITSVSGRTEEVRPHVHSQNSVQTRSVQSKVAMRKTTSVISSRFKRFKTFLHRRTRHDLVGENDADWSADVDERKLTTGYYLKFNGRDHNGDITIKWVSWEVQQDSAEDGKMLYH